MNLFVGLSPADERWWLEDKKANECWLPILKMVGFDKKQIRY